MNTQRFTIGTRAAALPKNADETREIPFILSTPQRDRHNTVLNQNAWRLENYLKNPIVGYGHAPVENGRDPDYVIGHDIKTVVEGSGVSAVLTGRLKLDPPDVNLLAEKVFRKLLIGSLRAASVTFIEVGKGAYGKGDESKGGLNETFYFSGQELIEWSVVNVPSNPGAGKRHARVSETSLPALNYILHCLGKNHTRSQVLNMKIQDVLTLLDGSDLGIRSTDPGRVAKLLQDPAARKDEDRILELQQQHLRSMMRTDTMREAEIRSRKYPYPEI